MIDPKNVEQGSPEWKELRRGHVTASNVADVMAKGKSGEAETRKKYKLRLIAERMSGMSQDSFSNADMEWGVEQEAYARMAYEVAKDVLVDKTGFWHHLDIAFVGVSPDGLVNDDGLVEIKCPKTETHIDYMLNDKVPAKYYKQIQCQLWVTGRQWCDFISFDPRMPALKQLFVIRCPRDDDFIATMEAEVRTFLTEIEFLMSKLEGSE
jgi:putative phage-type endonuclease